MLFMMMLYVYKLCKDNESFGCCKTLMPFLCDIYVIFYLILLYCEFFFVPLYFERVSFVPCCPKDAGK